jgi:hypothetical protein
VLDSPSKLESPSNQAITSATPTKAALVTLLVVGALVRLGLIFVFAGQEPEIVDAQDYNRLAIGLVETGEYRDASGNLTSLRPPFYPLLVAGLYQCFGLENYRAVRVAQAILSLFTLLLVYQLGKELYCPKVGLWAAAGYCFYPTLLGMNNLLLSEGLFTFFFVAAKGLIFPSRPTKCSVFSVRKRSATPTVSQKCRKFVQQPMLTCWQLSMVVPVV